MQYLQKDDYDLKKEQIDQMLNMGFTNEEIIKYLYPYMYYEIENILKKENIDPKNAEIKKIPNTAKIQIVPSKNGVKVDKNELFNKIIYNIKNKNSIIIFAKL